MAERTKMIALRLTPEELEILDGRADKLGLTRSELIRLAITKGELPRRGRA